MAKKFMPELSEKERVTILQQNADSIEETTYQKQLTEDEKLERKDVLLKNSIQLFDLEEEKKEAVKVFKDRIDPLKKENNQLLTELRTGQAKVDGTLYHMANHEDGMMEIYDSNGEIVESRRLRPNERQGKLYVAATGTNG